MLALTNAVVYTPHPKFFKRQKRPRACFNCMPSWVDLDF
jgi:hypothetical protein